MIFKTPYGTWRAKVKFRSVVVADRTFERKGDAVRWETEQKRLLTPASSSRRSGSDHRA